MIIIKFRTSKKQILDVINSSTNPVDDIFDSVVLQHGWEYVQQALFAVLLDDSCDKETYSTVADIFWGAVDDGCKIKKKTTIALLYYRLGDINAPYDNNVIWSITSELFHLDYCNSEYNPLKDERIIRKLKFYGLA